MNIITRSEAKTQGLKYYFTGEPCKRGHIVERMVSNFSCVQCVKDKKAERDKLYYEKHKDKIKQRVKDWTEANKDYYLEQQKYYYTQDMERRKTRSQNYYYSNHEDARQKQKEYYDENKKQINQRNSHNVRRRQAQKRNAVPGWFEKDKVRDLYLERDRITKETGIVHVVDHQVPLQHDLVCGLHCLANLCIIPWEDNAKKGNKFTV